MLARSWLASCTLLMLPSTWCAEQRSRLKRPSKTSRPQRPRPKAGSSTYTSTWATCALSSPPSKHSLPKKTNCTSSSTTRESWSRLRARKLRRATRYGLGRTVLVPFVYTAPNTDSNKDSQDKTYWGCSGCMGVIHGGGALLGQIWCRHEQP